MPEGYTKITGTLRRPALASESESPTVPNGLLKVFKVEKDLLISNLNLLCKSDANGQIEFYVLRHSVAYIWAQAERFDTKPNTGVPFAIPDVEEIDLDELVPAGGTIPSTAVNQTVFQAHAAKLANPDDPGHIENVGAGLSLEDGVISLEDNPFPDYLTQAEGDARYAESGSGVTDHGALSGLSDDDHPQYHNNARGDARYPLLTDPRLTDSRPPTGGAGGVLGGQFPNPSFAVDMATQAELNSEITARQDANDNLTLDLSAEITRAQAAEALKAPLASPTFTGTPAAPTPLTADVSTRIATTAYVDARFTALINAAPGALDTLGEIATQLANDESAVAALTTTVAGKQAGHANLTALSGLTLAADKIPYATGAGALALADLSSFARTLLDDANQAAMQSTLGLGTMATQAEANYALLAGRAGGQTLAGSSAASENLTLQSTSHATKGYILLGTGGLVGVNRSTPGAQLHVVAGAAGTISGIFDTAASPSAKILDLRLNGTSTSYFDSSGNLFAPAILTTTTGVRINSAGLSLIDSGRLLFYNAANFNTPDGSVSRQGVGVLQIGDGGANANGKLNCAEYRVAGNAVVVGRKTGWTLPTSTKTRTNADYSTLTLVQLAEVVAALVNDVHSSGGAHGLITA